MIVAGIDPSSAFVGLAEARHGQLVKTKVWSPKDDKGPHPKRLDECYRWLMYQLKIIKPDIVVVEKLAVFQNKADVVRVMGYYEGLALLAGARSARLVLSVQVSSGRKIVLGNGGLSKDKAWEAVKKMYPEIEFGPKTRGGLDRADAAVMALSGEDFAARAR